MSLWKAITTLDPNWLFVDQDALDTANQVAKRQSQIAFEQSQKGVLDNEKFQALNAEILGVPDRTYLDAFNDPDQSPAAGFVAGAREGLNKEAGLVNDALNGAAGLVWKAIPWWVWIGGLVALFFYFGGGVLVRRKLTH